MAKKKAKQRKMTPKEIRNFTSQKLDRVKVLMDSGKVLEGLVYMYHILRWLIKEKYNVDWEKSQTLKEFFTKLVQDEIIPSQNVYSYVNLLEEMLYSHHQLPPDAVDTYKSTWSSLYKDIVGDTPPSI